MNNYLIVADDFTGSNDTGVQICRRGIPVNVVFSGTEVTGKGSCVLDTESRSVSEKDAFEKLLRETEKIPFVGFLRVIKKVDSTLRGNIGTETKALDRSFGSQLIVFAPAFPDLGRTTVNCIHHLSGTPISKTELAKDPKTPVKIDDIQKIMAEAFKDEKVIHIGLDAIRSGAFDLEGGRIFCFDAALNEDLKTIVRTVLDTGKRVLWVGTAALADNLLNVERTIPPALAIVTSLSSVTRAQVHFAEKQGVCIVKAPLYAILEKNTRPEEIAAETIALLKEGKDVIMLSSSAYSEEEFQKSEESARRAGLSTEAMSAFTQKIIGQIAFMILERIEVSGLFLSGGDTAISCFESIGAKGSSIVTEIAVGIPLMRLAGGKYGGLKAVTKAGAFGKEDAIFYALRKLCEG